MLVFLIQQIPNLPTSTWEIILSNGVNGILLTVLLILIPFIILSFRFIITQIVKLMSDSISTLNESLVSIREELSGIGEKLEVQTAILVATHTQDHHDINDNGHAKNPKEAIMNLIKKKKEAK